MRFIRTSKARVDQLKKDAKKLQRKGGGKHGELLDRVARGAGYDHWHHVVLCATQTEQGPIEPRDLLAEVETILSAARAGIGKAIVVGHEAASLPLVLFSTTDGDAWLLDVDNSWAACLMSHFVDEPIKLRDSGDGLEVAWDGDFELRGPFFILSRVGEGAFEKVIAGFPLEELRPVIDRAQSFERKMDVIFKGVDALDLTSDLIAQLVRQGWDEGNLVSAAKGGARYSPSRHSLIFPPVTEDDDVLGVR